MTIKIIYGPPGTGKTTTLLQIVEKEFKSGIAPTNIAFVSFTRKAMREAIDRACELFDYTKDELPYFRTIHSLCRMITGINPFQIMGSHHYREIAEALNMSLEDLEQYIQFDGIVRTRQGDLWEEWNDHSSNTGAIILNPKNEYREQELVSAYIDKSKKQKSSLL